MMAATKESTITNNMTVNGVSTMGMSQHFAVQQHLTLMSLVMHIGEPYLVTRTTPQMMIRKNEELWLLLE
jgi:hypothetical protein